MDQPRTTLPVLDADPDGCCTTDLSAPLSRAEAERTAKLFKAVADPARLQLLALLRAAPAGEVCVCDFTGPLGLSQPTVSHHLKVLSDAGLVTRERRGTWAWYALVPDRLDELATVLGSPARA